MIKNTALATWKLQMGPLQVMFSVWFVREYFRPIAENLSTPGTNKFNVRNCKISWWCRHRHDADLVYQILKIVDRFLETFIQTDWYEVHIGSTDAIFILGWLQENHLAKSVYILFVLHRVCWNVLWSTLTKQCIEQWLVGFAQSMYRNAQIWVRVNLFKWWFSGQVELHQVSVGSCLVVIIVMEAVSMKMRSGGTEDLRYAV